jgi:hypothetical protein
VEVEGEVEEEGERREGEGIEGQVRAACSRQGHRRAGVRLDLQRGAWRRHQMRPSLLRRESAPVLNWNRKPERRWVVFPRKNDDIQRRMPNTPLHHPARSPSGRSMRTIFD